MGNFRRIPTTLVHLGIFILAVGLAVGASQAKQPQTPSPGSTRTPAAAIELNEDPLVLPSIGLRIRLPLGSHYETSQMSGSKASFTMYAEDNSWRMVLHNPASRDKSLTVTDVMDHLIAELMNAKAVRDPATQRSLGTQTRLLERQDQLVIGDQQAARFYASAPGGVGSSQYISGYTVFQVGPGRFAILEMDCPPAAYDKARGAYETVVATATFRDPVEMSAERTAGIRAAEDLLNNLTPEDIESLLPNEQWYRLYRPGVTGRKSDDQEVAYQRIEMKLGKRGELAPSRSTSRWRQSDKDAGYIVRVTGRFLDDSRIVDSDSVFFLTRDRDEEAWSIRMAIREGKSEAGWTETGVRLKDEIKVTIDSPGSPLTHRRWKRPPEAYLSQVGGYLLPRLLARRGAPGVFNFYRYNSRNTELSIRRDILELAPEKSPGAWLLRSRPAENVAEDSTYLDAKGRVIRRTQSDELVMEPIALEALKRLWRSKGLPMS